MPLISSNAFYWSAPISDVLTFTISVILLVLTYKSMSASSLGAQSPATIKNSIQGRIITISRQHGAGGREIGKKLAEKLGIPFYDKELTSLAASESGLAADYIDNIEEKDSILYSLYLSAEANQTAINAQDKILNEIAKKGACVLVGRAADHVLKAYNPYKVFIYAPLGYRKERIMKNYGDTESLAAENIEKADKRRAKFYENVSGKEWGNKDNYDLMVDSSIGIDKAVDLIYLAVKEK